MALVSPTTRVVFGSLLDLAFYASLIYTICIVTPVCNVHPMDPRCGGVMMDEKCCDTKVQYKYRLAWILVFSVHTVFNFILCPIIFCGNIQAALHKFHLLFFLPCTYSSPNNVLKQSLNDKLFPNTMVHFMNAFLSIGPLVLFPMTLNQNDKIFQENSPYMIYPFSCLTVLGCIHFIFATHTMRQAWNQTQRIIQSARALATTPLVQQEAQISIESVGSNAAEDLETETRTGGVDAVPVGGCEGVCVGGGFHTMPSISTVDGNTRGTNSLAQSQMHNSRSVLTNSTLAQTHTHTIVHTPTHTHTMSQRLLTDDV